MGGGAGSCRSGRNGLHGSQSLGGRFGRHLGRRRGSLSWYRSCWGRRTRLRAATLKLRANPLVADVLIYQEAVRYALEYGEFFKADEIATDAVGESLADALLDGSGVGKQVTA